MHLPTESEQAARVKVGGAKARYTQAEQVEMIKRDLLIDAECAERDAEAKSGADRDALLLYAAECRAKIKLSFTPGQFIYNRIESS